MCLLAIKDAQFFWDFGFRVLEQEAKDDLEVEPTFRADLQNKEAISGFRF